MKTYSKYAFMLAGLSMSAQHSFSQALSPRYEDHAGTAAQNIHVTDDQDRDVYLTYMDGTLNGSLRLEKDAYTNPGAGGNLYLWNGTDSAQTTRMAGSASTIQTGGEYALSATIYSSPQTSVDIRNFGHIDGGIYADLGAGLAEHNISNNKGGRIESAYTDAYEIFTGDGASTINLTNDAEAITRLSNGSALTLNLQGRDSANVENNSLLGSVYTSIMILGSEESVVRINNNSGSEGIISDGKAIYMGTSGTVIIENNSRIVGEIRTYGSSSSSAKNFQLNNGGTIEGNIQLEYVQSLSVHNSSTIDGSIGFYNIGSLNFNNSGNIITSSAFFISSSTLNFINDGEISAGVYTSSSTGSLIVNRGTIGTLEDRDRGTHVLNAFGENIKIEHRGTLNGAVSISGMDASTSEFIVGVGASSLTGSQNSFSYVTLTFEILNENEYGRLVLDPMRFSTEEGPVYVGSNVLFYDDVFLSLIIDDTANLVEGDSFTIVQQNNDGLLNPYSIEGTFANAPNTGDRISLGGYLFEIEYNPETIVLTVVPEPATCAAIFGALVLAFAAYRRRK